jgi:hypothetical protein
MSNKMTLNQAIKISEQRLEEARIINDFWPEDTNTKLTYDAQRLFDIAKRKFDAKGILEATEDLNPAEMMHRGRTNIHPARQWRNQQQVDITIWYATDMLGRAKDYSSQNNGTGQEFIALTQTKLDAAKKEAKSGSLLRDSTLMVELMNATTYLPKDSALTQNLENRLSADSIAGTTQLMLIATFALYLIASQTKCVQHNFLFAAGRYVVNSGSALAKSSYALTNRATQGLISFFYKPAVASPQIKNRLTIEHDPARTLSHKL